MNPMDVIFPATAKRLREQGWDGPCEAAFEWLVRIEPEALLRWVQSGCLEPAYLTFAAETLGKFHGHREVVPTLVKLLGHADAVVREGAVYGLARWCDGDPWILGKPAVLAGMKVALSDPSPGVLDAARELFGTPEEA